MTLYDQDFYSWTREQAEILKAGNFAALDVKHLIDELEALGKSEYRELVSHLAQLFTHLLEWEHQAVKRSTSWRLAIENQRIDVSLVFRQNPGLKHELPDILSLAYRKAVLNAARQTGIDREKFPASCPYTLEQALDSGFWPET